MSEQPTSQGDNDERYQEIMRRLARHKHQQQAQLSRRPLTDALNALNAWGVLEALCPHAPETVLAYGPASLVGSSRAAVVIWYHQRGFYGYLKLMLLGVWAQADPQTEAVTISAGQKSLPYTAAHYNPESYHKLIRKGYRLYYRDDGAPPAVPLLTFPYDAEQRLDQRQQLAEHLNAFFNRPLA